MTEDRQTPDGDRPGAETVAIPDNPVGLEGVQGRAPDVGSEEDVAPPNDQAADRDDQVADREADAADPDGTATNDQPGNHRAQPGGTGAPDSAGGVPVDEITEDSAVSTEPSG